ncbi:MAG: hypothetical protein R3E31_29910 [Chloroflexota bacterium]
MTISGPRLRTLLRQAESVANNGKRAAALTLYQQIIDEAPDAVEAWLGVAELAPELAEREAAYQKVLALEPENVQAQTGLAQLHGELVVNDAAVETAVSTPETADPFQQTQTWLEEATKPAQPHAATTIEPPTPTSYSEATADAHEETAVSDTYDLVCYRHPNRATALRCYSCHKPICSQCAIKTPVGYRCPDCIREAESVFFTAKPLDYLVAPLVSLPISLLAGFIMLQLSGSFFFILLTFFIGGLIGGFIGRVTKAAIGRRRGRYLPHVVAATVIIGGLVAGLPGILALLYGNLGGITGLLVPGIYTFVASSAAFYQMK